MDETSLPTRAEMVRAYLRRDAEYEGVFVTAVRTTGVFCRPSCPARKPRPENVEFFPTAREALLAGYRPCLRCRPMESAGVVPSWLAPLLERIEADPARRWRDPDLRALGVDPARARRWFLQHHGMTFHAYSRARRLGLALGRIQLGAGVASAAYDHGYESLSGFGQAFQRLLGAPPKRAGTSTVVTVTRIPTALGSMVAAATSDALVLLEFAERRMLERQLAVLRSRFAATLVPGENDVLRATAVELDRYFAGDLREFTVPLSTPGSALQRDVWDRLREVPYGRTWTYGELARRVGRPGAARPVGRAVGENRIAILVPCHRIVGSDGALTGYGGGLWRKRRLLDLERADPAGVLPLFPAA